MRLVLNFFDVIDVSLFTSNTQSAQSLLYYVCFLGLHIPKYPSQLLRCLDEGDATERYDQYQGSVYQKIR